MHFRIVLRGKPVLQAISRIGICHAVPRDPSHAPVDFALACVGEACSKTSKTKPRFAMRLTRHSTIRRAQTSMNECHKSGFLPRGDIPEVTDPHVFWRRGMELAVHPVLPTGQRHVRNRCSGFLATNDTFQPDTLFQAGNSATRYVKTFSRHPLTGRVFP